MPADRLDEVLDSAYDCLTRYGVRRTTMDDIATGMGVSRSTLYLYVNNKDDAFRRLAARLHTQALARARTAATAPDAPCVDRIRDVLAAKLDLVLHLSGDSPHTTELLDHKTRLFADICHTFTADLRHLLTALFTEAGIPGAIEPAETGAPVAIEPAAAGASSVIDPADPGAPSVIEPAEAADICLALVAGLESAPDARRLLTPATDALLTGLLGAPTPIR
ncbi:TetR/AcrR family transcriptional regulator [Streptomyces sp. NPDC047043]|uniref:TetR/AcrR family transcriptional regulator n=1 Tax=Streptomyces sp. NPDC047043 TaxID=3154497 RepID=UPI0034016748